MYCMTVTYPAVEGTRFDMDYYRDNHMPLCERLLAEHGFLGAVLRTDQGPAPGKGGLAYASLDLLFASAEQLGAGLAAHGKEISADIANYTDSTPTMVFSEVAVDLRPA